MIPKFKLQSTNYKLQKGFTLIELLVTIAIIGVVFGVIISSAVAIQRRGRDTQRLSDLNNIKSALQQYYADQNAYPESMDLSSISQITNCTGVAGSCTVSRVYLSSVPKDPASTFYKYYPTKNDNTVPCTAKECQRFVLCTKMELPETGSSCSMDNTNYNFELKSL